MQLDFKILLEYLGQIDGCVVLKDQEIVDKFTTLGRWRALQDILDHHVMTQQSIHGNGEANNSGSQIGTSSCSKDRGNSSNSNSGILSQSIPLF